jgi:hypothetical protein
MATFKIIIDKRHKLENDKYHLTLRVSNKQEVLYLRLGAQMTVKEYEKHFVKKTFDKEVDKVRSKFEKCVDRAKKILPSIEPFESKKFREKYYDTSFDPDNIVTEEQKKRGTVTYLFQNYIKVKSESKEIGLSSVNLINGTLNNIKKFKDTQNVRFQLNRACLKLEEVKLQPHFFFYICSTSVQPQSAPP